ncbi:hypothetical protein PCE31107_03487 [Pandoraea cepalis]|uniref:Transposase n=1 Tax=Pandoraea cepalis TaxID=2508294 RepID=A0A5E4WV42_9BURK|nr:hypothetical protein PCE31107_03487 [Pandoraea cepalis]
MKKSRFTEAQIIGVLKDVMTQQNPLRSGG